jgi:hypothetical protein
MHDLSGKSILGIMSLLLLLVSSVLGAKILLVKATGTGYTQPPGLVSYWNLDQDSGTTAYDSSDSNHGIIYGASLTSGKVNDALNFDGLDDYVDCGNDETLDPTLGATLEAWVNFNRLPSAANHIMAIAGRSGDGTDLDLQAETDNKFKFYIGIGAPNVAISNTVAETNKWYHIVGTYQANDNVKIYVNGVLEKTTSISITRDTNPNNFCIGQSGHWSGRFFNGVIDEVKIFNRALSAEEIRAEYIHVSLSPSSSVMNADQSQKFTLSVSGGNLSYAYQWCMNDTVIGSATSSTYTFTPKSSGHYNIYANVTDNFGITATSNTATVTANIAATPTPTEVPTSPTPLPTETPTSSTPTPTPEPTGPGFSPEVFAVAALGVAIIIAITLLVLHKRKK